MVLLEENFKWHLEAFASELFILTNMSSRTKINHLNNLIQVNLGKIKL